MTTPPRPRRSGETGLRADAEAALAARHELGPEYDEHVAAGLADRVEELVAYRTAELRARPDTESTALQMQRSAQHQGFVLGIISLGAGIPITAIAATNTAPGILGVAVAWAGIVGVNVAHRLSGRPRR